MENLKRTHLEKPKYSWEYNIKKHAKPNKVLSHHHI